ncbi:MAG: L-2-amino-thiazoline-4-carboxylic acid hydrolase [Thermovirgaceae bacterium]
MPEKHTVDFDEAKEQVRKVCRRLALLHLAYARTLTSNLGNEEGKKCIVEAIKEYGRMIGEEVRSQIAAQGLENIPDNYKEDLPSWGMYEKGECRVIDGKKHISAYGCVMGKTWIEEGEPELGQLYCLVDPAKYMSFNPKYKLVHKKNILKGDSCCELTVEPTTQDEQIAFLEGSEWSFIDN